METKVCKMYIIYNKLLSGDGRYMNVLCNQREITLCNVSLLKILFTDILQTIKIIYYALIFIFSMHTFSGFSFSVISKLQPAAWMKSLNNWSNTAT